MAPLADPLPWAGRGGYLPYWVSVAVWYLLSAALAWRTAHVFAAAVLPDTPRGTRRWWYARLVPLYVCAGGVGFTLGRGQVNVLLLWFVAELFAAAVRGRAFAAGLWLAAAVSLKVIPGFLSLFHFVRGEWEGGGRHGGRVAGAARSGAGTGVGAGRGGRAESHHAHRGPGPRGHRRRRPDPGRRADQCRQHGQPVVPGGVPQLAAPGPRQSAGRVRPCHPTGPLGPRRAADRRDARRRLVRPTGPAGGPRLPGLPVYGHDAADPRSATCTTTPCRCRWWPASGWAS